MVVGGQQMNFIKCFLEIQIDYIYRWPLVHSLSYFIKNQKNITNLLGMILLLGTHAEAGLLISVWWESPSYDP